MADIRYKSPQDFTLRTQHSKDGAGVTTQIEDPFTGNSSEQAEQRRVSHRYSSFDTHLFMHHQPSVSPSSTKRVLEAHISETDRRLEEASRLGTALVQQRTDLANRLKEVEQQQDEEEITPVLRQKLDDVEKEYNELGRESAKMLLGPKSRHSGPEEGTNSVSNLDTGASISHQVWLWELMRI